MGALLEAAAPSGPGQLYEERYGGKTAARFRAFSSVYGALLTNGVLIGYVLRGFTQAMHPFSAGSRT